MKSLKIGMILSMSGVLTYSFLHPNFFVYQSFVHTSISDLDWIVKYHYKMKISFRMHLEHIMHFFCC
jgi:hypothetical protein